MLLSITTALLLAASAVSGATPHGLDTHPWGRWAPGTWVETESSLVGSDGPGMVERYELTELDEDGYSLGSALVMQGGPDVETNLQRTWAFGGFPQHVEGARIVGKENVSLGGRNYACDVWEARTKYKGKPMLDRAWIAAGVDLPLKVVIGGAEGQIALSATRLSEPVSVGRRKVLCVRYEGEASVGERKVEMTQWVSLDVPGGVVRLDTSGLAGGAKQTFRREVTAFQGEKRPARDLRR